ncbi:MAG: SPOR domain-containing protein [Spirochaetia bacterium]|jgi:cell division protein FtsN|nr:SPOR domain-containing protein [Spirochaetia bacterium]
MEQQKILWIILSVAVLLLAVLGTILFVFGPSTQDSALVSSGKDLNSGSFDPVEWARSSEEYPGVVETETAGSSEGNEDFIVIYGEGLGKDEVPFNDVKEADSAVVTLNVKKAEPAAAPKETAVSPPAPAPVKPAPAAVKKPAPPSPKKVTEYWIQAGSFSSRTKAEEARKLLASKGFSATLQTKLVDSKTFYRVRVGAYPAKEEAEKFLYWVKDIDGFSQSYISQVQVMR